MLSNSRATNQNWFIRWVVKRFCVEIPIIGPCIEHPDWGNATRGAIKCTSMLLGSALGMLLTTQHIHESKTMSEMSASEIGTMIGGMLVGMYAGKVGYGVTEDGLLCLFKLCKQRCSNNFTTPETEELEHMMSTDMSDAQRPGNNPMNARLNRV